MKDEKVRKQIVVSNENGEILAKGVYYRDGNVQILWRKDIGWTSEQYDSIANLIGILEGANTIQVKQT